MSKERDKAQEVFDKSVPVFGSKGPFSEAYPEIETVQIEVEEYNFQGHFKTHHRSENNVSEFVNCSNPMCYGGGVCVGFDVIGYMVAKKLTEYEGEKVSCGRREGTSSRDRRCLHSFKVRAKIKYKDDTAKEEKSADGAQSPSEA